VSPHFFLRSRLTVADVASLIVHEHKFYALQTLNALFFLPLTEKDVTIKKTRRPWTVRLFFSTMKKGHGFCWFWAILVIYSKEFLLQGDFCKKFLLGKKDQWRLMAFNARPHFPLCLIKRSMAFNVFALMTMGINVGRTLNAIDLFS